ncbi:hypothetical protein AAHB46_01250 [Bacillus paranthracis]
MGQEMVNHIYREENHFHPKAVYLPQQVKEYEGNPFLETLPPILSMESLYKSLAVYPHFNKEERLHPKELRAHYVMRLNSFFSHMVGKFLCIIFLIELLDKGIYTEIL